MVSTTSHNTQPQAKTTTTQHATVLCLMFHPPRDRPKTQQCTHIHQPATRHHNQPPPTTHSMRSTPSHNPQPQAKTTTTQHATVLYLMFHPRTTQHQPTPCQPVPIIMWHNQYPEI